MKSTQSEKANIVRKDRQNENVIVENLELAKRLKESREKSGLFQVDVARRLNTNSSVISNYERAFRDPSTVTLKRLAVIYNVSTDYLLGLIDTPRPPQVEKEVDYLLHLNVDSPSNSRTDIEQFREVLEVMTQKKINELQQSANSIMSSYFKDLDK